MPAKKIAILITLILVTGLAGIILTSCGAVSYMDSRGVSDEYIGPESPPFEAYDDMAKSADAPERGEVFNGRVGETALRRIIRSGSIELTVEDTRETIREIRGMIEAKEGIISSSNIYEMREGQYGANLTLRIPNKNFDSVMAQLETYGKATNIQTGLDDVTMHYIDLESRLNNQKAQEKRLVEILDMAENVEEVLEVEKELYRVRGEVETMTAQFNYLKDQVSYSTIHLLIREETIPTGAVSPGAFHDLGSRIAQAFIGSINVVLNSVSFIIIAFSALLPILIILGVIVILVWLLVRKLSKRKDKAESNIELKQE